MAVKAYMVMTHDDGKPTEVVTPDGRLGLLFPRADDDGKEIFYGHPEVNKAVFRVHPGGKKEFILGGISVEEIRKLMADDKSTLFQPGSESWELVEDVTVTFW